MIEDLAEERLISAVAFVRAWNTPLKTMEYITERRAFGRPRWHVSRLPGSKMASARTELLDVGHATCLNTCVRESYLEGLCLQKSPLRSRLFTSEVEWPLQ